MNLSDKTGIIAIIVILVMGFTVVAFLVDSMEESEYCSWECECEQDCEKYGLEFLKADHPFGHVDCYCWDGNRSVQLY